MSVASPTGRVEDVEVQAPDAVDRNWSTSSSILTGPSSHSIALDVTPPCACSCCPSAFSSPARHCRRCRRRRRPSSPRCRRSPRHTVVAAVAAPRLAPVIVTVVAAAIVSSPASPPLVAAFLPSSLASSHCLFTGRCPPRVPLARVATVVASIAAARPRRRPRLSELSRAGVSK